MIIIEQSLDTFQSIFQCCFYVRIEVSSNSETKTTIKTLT